MASNTPPEAAPPGLLWSVFPFTAPRGKGSACIHARKQKSHISASVSQVSSVEVPLLLGGRAKVALVPTCSDMNDAWGDTADLA